MSSEKYVDLGFLEEVDPSILTSEHFPSKAGGKPAWLDLLNLPLAKDLVCPYCEKQLSFLLQIYTPVDNNPDCYHRTVYVFCCKDPKCHETGPDCFRVLRSQLPKKNSFYDVEITDAKKNCALCSVCGCRGDKKCGKCQMTSYCSVDHQTWDWKENYHKTLCGSSDNNTQQGLPSILWPEFNLEIDSEDIEESEDSENEEETENEEKERLERYKELVDKMNVERNKEGDVNLDKEEVPFDEKSFKMDDAFLAFQDKIRNNPDQVLRYVRDCPEGALWISDENVPTQEDIPLCSLCKGHRQLEFQILPQILYYLKATEVDWGVLGVYTCPNHCVDNDNAYVIEYLFRQLVSLRPTVELME